MASVAHEHGAEVTALGPIGTRPADSDHLLRTRPSKANALVFVSEAGPCGDWLYRDLTQNGSAGWGVAPALLPQQAGDRVHTDRREAVPLARLRRSGARTPVEVPAGDDDASRELRRARDEAIGALQAAKRRRKAFWRRHDRRDPGRATGRASTTPASSCAPGA